MSRLDELTAQINALTLKLEEDYPELYIYLEETPITLPNGDPTLTIKSFEDYLESLQKLLQHHIENHGLKVGT